MTATRQPTCRTYRTGQAYFHTRRKVLVRVPKGQVHLVCEACEYVVTLTERVYGLHGAEEVRKHHIKTAHLTALIDGVVSLREEPK